MAPNSNAYQPPSNGYTPTSSVTSWLFSVEEQASTNRSAVPRDGTVRTFLPSLLARKAHNSMRKVADAAIREISTQFYAGAITEEEAKVKQEFRSMHKFED